MVNQWEPPGTVARQFAFRCYQANFPNDEPGVHVNLDIAQYLDDVEGGARALPAADLLVGGFPCQDYSVAKPLAQAHGIHGKKGVLWWEIYRLLELAGEGRPRYLLLENVDRLLKSPATNRGRDFAIILSCLNKLGYSVEWRVINAADYGEPQRRRRVFIYAELNRGIDNLAEAVVATGVLAKALPVETTVAAPKLLEIDADPYVVSETFSWAGAKSQFDNAGVMSRGKVYSASVTPLYDGPRKTLGSILDDEASVPSEYYLSPESLKRWRYFKGSKSEPRTEKKSGFTYTYSEGGMSFPDPLDRPARTILTGEGGVSPSRFKHVVEPSPGRFRRLTPGELEAANGFPKGWTDTGMSVGQRAFCMGNALVVGIVERIAIEILRHDSASTAR